MLIEPNIPIPDKARRSKIRDLIATMNQGDSILVEKRGHCVSVSRHIRERGMKAIVRKDGEKFRVWAV